MKAGIYLIFFLFNACVLTPKHPQTSNTKATPETKSVPTPDLSFKLSEIEKYLRDIRGQVEILDKKQKDQATLIQELDARLTKLSKAQIERDPFKQAEIFFQQEKWKSAIVYYEKYRKNNTTGLFYMKATFQIGLCFKKLKMEKEMQVFAQELIDRFPKSEETKIAREWLKKPNKK